MKEELIPRPRYIDRARLWFGTRLIKILTGQRRVGKSSILRNLVSIYGEEQPEIRLVFIDKELSEWDRIHDAASLEQAASSKGGERVALFIDEAQEIPGFERAIRSLATDGLHDIWVTGSNARLLSGDIATLFAGRTATLRIRALDYGEFLRFHAREDSDESLALYLRYGGLPFLRNLRLADETAFEYLHGVFDAIVLKDLVQRHGVRNPAILARIVEFLADTIGSPVSARNVANYLKSKGIDASPQTILDYFGHLTDAYGINRVRAEDLQGKRLLESGDKYYFEDLGLRSVARGFDQRDIGKIVENAVYLKLAAEGWEINSGRAGDREIDFVCERAGKRIYVQATYLVPDGPTRVREFGSLLALRDAWPRFVVSMDPIRADQEGVRHLSLREFLLHGEGPGES
ncbi:MAG TPA: ATP-binding protein [Spirochaetia bacterium]|nr:ATP-binding protein [Spirochaetia bacterium]